jgi:hypothetical protein
MSAVAVGLKKFFFDLADLLAPIDSLSTHIRVFVSLFGFFIAKMALL